MSAKKNEFNIIFTTAINDGLTAARGIIDTTKRAEVFAQLALAIAQTGLVTGSEEAPEQTIKQNMGSEDIASIKRHNPNAKVEEAPAKVEKKVDAKKALKPVPDKTKAVKAKEPAWTAEWTEEAITEFEEELTTLEALEKDLGDDLGDLISEFSSGKYKSSDDLTPLNIRAFIVYVEELEKSMAEEAAE